MSAPATRDSACRERGAIFFLALLMMAASVTFGIAYVSAASSQLAIQDRQWERVRARAIAEGGLDMALHGLKRDGAEGSVSGVALGTGTYGYTVTPSAGGYDIDAEGTAGGVDVHYQAHVASVSSEIAVDNTIMTRGSVQGDPATPITWNHVLRYSGDLDFPGNGRSERLPVFDPITLQSAEYGYTTRLLPAQLLLPGTHSGHLLSDLGQSVLGTFQLDGSLYVNGSLTIEALGGVVELNATDTVAVLYVEGNLTIRDASEVSIEGGVFVEGNITFDNVDQLHAFGSLVANGNIQMGINTGTGYASTWEFDPNILAFPPPVVGGGPRNWMLTESWRRYHTQD